MFEAAEMHRKTRGDEEGGETLNTGKFGKVNEVERSPQLGRFLRGNLSARWVTLASY